ncbi:dTDP-4-dehydrorhamnose 3,5-epimerase [Ancylobacter sp. SL191]|uniref:dTDP-4-dehydrorhamnose 3,5-epimerase n=1 Tax=Ancylobacter sp. SL191 TaxID=2995166 RepID=UPI00226E6DB5|nr:dTDP-4-dehydrorhamnose 3,5-epimerase [Ancylobacter sp. SL191]WAC29259.1 dTDP-4-dehydrorhamnose 3,5-epimerase [Ancylobacter sp. SL191]
MRFDRFDIADLLLVTPKRIGDERGWFSEIFREDLFRAEAGDVHFVQHNQSYSRPKGTVRGLHFQLEPKAQGKLVRCARGRMLDVAVDLRRTSPTFGRHVAVELSAENGCQFWIPAGFAHGFCTLTEDCEVAYLVTDYYSAAHDRGLLWNDSELAIAWPVKEEDAILSEKDRRQPRLRDLGPVFA